MMSGAPSDDTGKVASAEAIGRLFENLPQEYEQRAAALRAMFFAFKQKLAEALTPAMNKELQGKQKFTFEQRQEVCEWIRREIHSFDLAIRDPKTGRAASIIANKKGGIGERSRFRFVVRADDGKQLYTLTRQELPRIELMVAGSPPTSFTERESGRRDIQQEPQR